MSPRTAITQGRMALELAPELGGAIASLRFEGFDILRALPDGQGAVVNQSGCFPLVPYSNRIANARFEFDGRHFELEKNFGDHPHSIHGNAWQRAWEVTEIGESAVTLSFTHNALDGEERHWPWPYQATQVFRLSDRELTVDLTYTNLATQTVPVGLGFHPYFAEADKALLQFEAGKVLFNDAGSLPIGTYDVPAAWNYLEPLAVVAGSIDNCFCDWSGHSAILWPDRRLRMEISAPQARNAVLFIPPAVKNFIAIEPVTNVNNAINDLAPGSDERAMQLVAPGQTLCLQMKIGVSSYE